MASAAAAAALGCGLLTVASASLVYLVRALAGRWLVDVPNERSSHVRPVPRGGGLGFVAPLLLVAALAWPFGGRAAFVVAGAAAIAAISLADDLRPLSSTMRLAVQGASAILALFATRFSVPFELPFGLHVEGLAAQLLWFLWIVGLTNAYNFMDGIDGIAGLQAVIGGLAWALVAGLKGDVHVAVLGAFLAAAVLGFLLHNWHPARIFMGDVGSAFLGYAFAVVPLLAHASSPRASLVGLLIVSPFVLDAGFTFCRRLAKRENVFAAHRSHLYQRLVIAGYSHAVVSSAYGSLALVGGGLAVYLSLYDAAVACSVAGVVPGVGLVLTVRRVERRVRAASAAAVSQE